MKQRTTLFPEISDYIHEQIHNAQQSGNQQNRAGQNNQTKPEENVKADNPEGEGKTTNEETEQSQVSVQSTDYFEHLPLRKERTLLNEWEQQQETILNAIPES